MLIKKVEEVVLFFDNEEEALINYEEIEALNNCIERKIYKDYSEEFKKWVYKINYKRILY